MSDAFVFTATYRKQPTLRVCYKEGTKLAGKTKNYPLTRDGCVQAGRDLFKNGAEHWWYSSTADFPECKPRCRLDIRKIVEDAFNAELEEFQRPHNELVDLIMKWCRKKDFQDTLTPKQQALFWILDRKIKKGEV